MLLEYVFAAIEQHVCVSLTLFSLILFPEKHSCSIFVFDRFCLLAMFKLRSGPSNGHFSRIKWFDSAPLKDRMQMMNVSMRWHDQGWGNRKGQVWLCLVRDDVVIVVDGYPHKMFPIAPHEPSTAVFETSDPGNMFLSKRYGIFSLFAGYSLENLAI